MELPRSFRKYAEVMNTDHYWDLHFSVIQLLYPLYRLLRLADMCIGGMDRVKFYILQINRLYPAALDDVVKKWEECQVWLQLAGMHNDGVDLAELDKPADDAEVSDEEEAAEGKSCFVCALLSALLTHLFS